MYIQFCVCVCVCHIPVDGSETPQRLRLVQSDQSVYLTFAYILNRWLLDREKQFPAGLEELFCRDIRCLASSKGKDGFLAEIPSFRENWMKEVRSWKVLGLLPGSNSMSIVWSFLHMLMHNANVGLKSRMTAAALYWKLQPPIQRGPLLVLNGVATCVNGFRNSLVTGVWTLHTLLIGVTTPFIYSRGLPCKNPSILRGCQVATSLGYICVGVDQLPFVSCGMGVFTNPILQKIKYTY